MAEFPQFSPTNVNPMIDERFNHPDVDYLGHPYSSHVNSTFWKLHGWVDETIEHWRIANGIEVIEWSDTWSGDYPSHSQPDFAELSTNTNSISNLKKMHNHFPHGHHGWEEMFMVFEAINSFQNCHASFSYIQDKSIPLPSL